MSPVAARPIRTVFCATDFSPTAELALAHAAALARRHAARLVLGHVVEPWPTTLYPPVSVLDDTERVLRAAATERLRTIAASLSRGGSSVETRVVAGAPGRESVELARAVEADVMVVGTHGRSGLAHLVYGSTAEYIVRCSAVPVLTVHPHDAGPEARLTTLVAPTDFSPAAERAVEELARLAPLSPDREAASKPRIVLIHVDEIARYFEPYGEEVIPAYADSEARLGELGRALEVTAARLRGEGFEVESRVVAGRPVQVVCEVAREVHASLIVLGTHGHSPVMNFLMGRTAQRIVQHAPCPVLSVRAPERSVTPP